jgi:hypothetical protein
LDPAFPISARTSYADNPEPGFQLFDQFLQLGDEGVLFGHHRLLMLTCRALDRQLELHRLKGFQYLDRKVRELAEIDGLRHAAL